MDALWIVIATVCGGLGMFLLGMRHLSDGLQGASGEGLRHFMQLATLRRMAGVATGAVATLLMQSSSIVTVMLVGFVTSRLMTLTESIYVLIGANIGTTFTIWLMAFAPSPELLGLATLSIGMLCYYPFRKGKLRHVGRAMVGLGLVVLGMFFMKEGVEPVKSSPTLTATLAALDATSVWGVLAVAGISAAFTAVIQSSAASILIFMTFASQGLVTYETAVAALFGANVGTTATLWLATIGGGSSARRLALAHTLTNLVGSLVCIPFALTVFAPLGKWLFPDWATRVMVPIAITDTVFSLVRGALVFPFTKHLTKLLEWLVPEKADEKPHLSAFTVSGRLSAVIACEQAAEEVCFMAESVNDLMAHVRLALTGEADDKAKRHILKREDVLDNIQSEVTTFLGEVMIRRLPSSTAKLARSLLRLADEFESASDEAPAILRALDRIHAEGDELTGSDLAMILDIHDHADRLSHFTRADLQGISTLKERTQLSADLKKRITDARQLQLMRVGAAGSSAASVLAALDILNAYDRIRAYSINIAETCAGGKIV